MVFNLPPELINRRVVIIEDAAVWRRLIREELANESLELFEAEDGESGLALCRRVRPALILLDLVLPGMNGFEIFRRLREDPQLAGAAVIFLSGAASTEQRVEGLDLGAADFMTKPFHGLELRARVRSALRAKHQRDQLDEQAHRDALTGLGNRHALEERFRAAWSLCARRVAPLSVLIADLDHFKRINDAHGHSVGDDVLRWVAEIFRRHVRGGDFVGRFGGEEFVVLAMDCKEVGAVEIAERFRCAIALESPRVWGLRHPVTISVGVAVAHDPGRSDPARLLASADHALYQAKAQGRNTVYYWEDDDATSRPASLLLQQDRPACLSGHPSFAI